MASAELDYSIEIPDQPCWSQKNPSQDGKEARKRLPVVILLGWGGCRDKNLAKYSAIYHKRNISSNTECDSQVAGRDGLIIIHPLLQRY